MKNNYIIGSKNEAFGPGSIQNAITDTLVKTKGAIDAKLINKNVSENGIYKAKDDNADGYNEVMVNIVNENNAKFIKTSATKFNTSNIGGFLESIEIPEGFTSISGNGLKGGFASNLKFISLPATLTEIGSECFQNSECEIIKFNSTIPPTVGLYAFEGLSTTCKILVPSGTLEAYKATPGNPDPAIYTYEEF